MRRNLFVALVRCTGRTVLAVRGVAAGPCDTFVNVNMFVSMFANMFVNMQNIQSLQKLQHMNYGNYRYDKIKTLLFFFLEISNFPNN